MLLGFTMSGCVGFYVPEDYTYTPSKEAVKEQKVHDSIMKYVQERSPSGYNYKSLEFGEVYVIKDDEIKKLDQLIEEKNYLPFKKDEYGDQYEKKEKELQEKIDQQKKYLKDNKIYPWYEVNHLYAFENVISDSAIVYEFDFELYPNYTVKDVHKKMDLTLDPKRYKMFKYFLAQSPVYETNDWMYNEQKNNEFYTAAYAALENESDYKDKLLLTIIDMTQYIYDKDSFDENDFAKKQMLRWEKEKTQDDMKTISISQLGNTMDTINGQAILVGYKMKHDFYTESIEEIRRFEFDFDLNYVIVRVTEIKVEE